MFQVLDVRCQVSVVSSQVSGVLYHVSYVIILCHLSPVTNANRHRLALANSPTMHSRLVCKEPKTQKKF